MNRIRKTAIFVAAAIAIFIAATLLLSRRVSIADAVTFARSLRGISWLPLAYFAAYALLDLACIPTHLLSIIAAVVWGWRVGGTIELFAATIGAIPPYFIARRFEDRFQERVDSFSLLLFFRLVPIIPYSILNYVAGLSVITPLPYVVATFIGIIPSTFIFAYFVDSLAAGVVAPAAVTMRVIGAGALLAIFVIATRLVARAVKPVARPDRADERQGVADPAPRDTSAPM